MANMIRNISQTAQERTIVKTAPDLVVYLEGLPYLLNYFINDPSSGRQYTLVNFNDYVTNFQASYDTDNLIPTCSFSLQVPNYQKYLFQMPGGNNLIQSMMQVQVFAKGYFFASDGSTVLRRVFKGVVSHIGYNDTGKMLEIGVQCRGILHFMELMQVDLSPAAQSSSNYQQVPTQTQLAYLNPYLMLLDMFVRATSTEGFYTNSLNGGVSNLNLNNGTATVPGDLPSGKVNQGAFAQAIQAGYIAKWQSILNNIRNDVHIYGLQYKDSPTTTGRTQDSSSKGTEDRVLLSDQAKQELSKTEVDQLQDFLYVTDTTGNNPFPAIRQYTPDQSVSNVQLFNPTYVNRLEEIRHILRVLTYEGYQDINGKIIFKPPLYNLDVTYIGTETSTTPTQTGGPSTPQNSLTEIYENNNPFVIQLDEIISEQETEDQAAIRMTRMTVLDNWSTSIQMKGHQELLTVVEYIDVGKLQKFGLREQPSAQCGFFAGDKFGLFGYAASEVARANRGYRTYSCTIPLRPELKLGFPVFIPHRDMYGYLKSVSINYNTGGTATMTLMLDTLRRRPLIPTLHTDQNGAKTQIFTSAPNLVYRWTTGAAATAGTNDQVAPTNQSTAQAPLQNTSNTQPTQNQLTTGNQNVTGSQSNQANPASLVGNPTTLPLTPDQAASPDQKSLITLRQQILGNTWGTETDSSVCSFRIQNDTYQRQKYTTDGNGNVVASPDTNFPSNGGIFTKQRFVDQNYYHDIRRTIPFTDDKGYEVVAPFPWGRWISLRKAVKEMTQDGYIAAPPTDPTTGQPLGDTTTATNVNAFLFAGLGTPTVNNDTVNTLQSYLSGIQQAVQDNTIIVLQYNTAYNPFPQTTPSDQQLLNAAQPDDSNIAVRQQLFGTETAGEQLIDVLVSGTIAPSKTTQESLLATQSTIPTKNIGLTPSPSAPPNTLPQFQTDTSNQSGTE